MNDQVTQAETTEILRLAEQFLSVPGDFVELGCYRGDTSVLLAKLLQKSAPSTSTSARPVENSASSCGKPVENITKFVEKQIKPCGNPVQNHQPKVENSQNPVENPKRLWLYDSFAGLPDKTSEDASGAGANFQAGELAVTKREVIDKIRKHGLKNVIIKKAWFDDLTDLDLPSQIAFAFCDGDLYASIKTSLRLVLPRLAPQGIIIVHDYNNPELPGSARAVDEFLRAHPNFRLTVRHTLAILTQNI